MDHKLYNRYGDKLYLKEISEYVYTLEGNTDWCRIIYKDAGMTTIDAIDPSGGPYMSVGNFSIDMNRKVLNKITEETSGKFIFEFIDGSLNLEKEDEKESSNR